MDHFDLWTLSELVAQVARATAELPPPSNGQVRAVPDERTVRYYATIGLLDPPAAMRGRTGLYGPRHLAQVVAIKRLQAIGRSLAELQVVWPTLDDASLARMSGIPLRSIAAGPPPPARKARAGFWKQAAEATPPVEAPGAPGGAVVGGAREPLPVELRLALAPDVSLAIALPDEVALSADDVRAIRAAAAPLLAELARCRLAPNAGGEEP